jgi:hypothetical protein
MTAAALEIQRYSDDLKGVWDGFVAATKNRSFLFQRDYMDYHRDRFQDHSLLFRLGGKLLASLPAHVVQGKLCSHQGLTFGGLLMCRDIRLGQLKAIASALRDHLRSEGLSHLDYRPMPHPYHEIPAEEDIVALAAEGASLSDARAVPFAQAGNTRLSRDRLRDLRDKSLADLIVRRSEDIRGFMEYCAEHGARRFNSKLVHSPDEMVLLAARFPDNIQHYVVERAGEVLAGTILYRHGNCAKVQYSAPASASVEDGVMTHLYCRLLSDILPAGHWVDFGHSHDLDGNFNPGVHQFKESLGARTVLFARYNLAADGRTPP